MTSFTMAHAFTSINANIRDNQHYYLGTHGSLLDEKMGRGNFPRKYYEIKNMDTSLFKVEKNTNNEFHIEEYNNITLRASLEFQSYDKTTDQYEAKITLLPGVSFTNYDRTKPNAYSEFKNSQILFADTRQATKIITGKINKNIGQEGAPIVDQNLVGLFTLTLSLKHDELILTTLKQIPIIIEDTF